MNVFNNYYQPQQPNMVAPANQAYYYTFQEAYNPDYSTYPIPSDFQAPYQVYNLDLNSQIANNQHNYYVYRPEAQNNYQNVQQSYGSGGSYSSGNDVESILRKNQETWDAYKSGRFEVIDRNENGGRKIILKEKSYGRREPEYTIRRFRVHLSRRRNSQPQQQPAGDDEHILLVSYSNTSVKPDNEIVVNETEYVRDEYTHEINQRAHSIRSSNDDAYLTGPGSDLIKRIVNDEDEPQDYNQPTSSVEESLPKGSSRLTARSNQSRQVYSEPAVSDSYGSSAGGTGFYPQQPVQTAYYLTDLKNKAPSEGQSFSERSEKAASNYSRERTPARDTPASSVGQFVAQDVDQRSAASGISGSQRVASGLSAGERVGSRVSADLPQSSIGESFVQKGSRPNTRISSSQLEVNQETQSIGPGSLAGGSLFGGFIPSNFETASQRNISSAKQSQSAEELNESQVRRPY